MEEGTLGWENEDIVAQLETFGLRWADSPVQQAEKRRKKRVLPYSLEFLSVFSVPEILDRIIGYVLEPELSRLNVEYYHEAKKCLQKVRALDMTCRLLHDYCRTNLPIMSLYTDVFVAQMFKYHRNPFLYELKTGVKLRQRPRFYTSKTIIPKPKPKRSQPRRKKANPDSLYKPRNSK